MNIQEAIEVPEVRATSKGPYRDTKVYRFDGKQGLWRRVPRATKTLRAPEGAILGVVQGPPIGDQATLSIGQFVRWDTMTKYMTVVKAPL